MKTLIIEDEPRTAIDLANTVKEVEPSSEILQITDSIEGSVRFLRDHPMPDLIFMDIELADGSSFEIFKQIEIRCPVIFCTAYDAFALQAFQTNGVDYLLKPFDAKAVGRALAKVQGLAQFYRTGQHDPDQLIRLAEQVKSPQKTSFLVSFQGKFLPVQLSDIAFFTVLGEAVWLYNFKGEHYYLPHSLEELENMVGSNQFYRANRQYLINFDAIRQVEHGLARKLTVKLAVKTPDPVTVSKAKAGDFLRWMNER